METVMNVKISERGTKNHYWDDKGENQATFDELTKTMMPASGSADTVNGEMVRAANRLYYEYCNNGNMNACETHEEYDYDTDEYYDGDNEVNPFYSKFLELLRNQLATLKVGAEIVIDGIENVILGGDEGYGDDTMSLYDQMVDYVVAYVTTQDDKPLPNWYVGD